MSPPNRRVFSKDDHLPVPSDIYLTPSGFKTHFTMKHIDKVSENLSTMFPDTEFQHHYTVYSRIFTYISNTLTQEPKNPFTAWVAASLFKHLLYWLGIWNYQDKEDLQRQFHSFLWEFEPILERLVETKWVPSETHIQECVDLERSLTRAVFSEYPVLASLVQRYNKKMLKFTNQLMRGVLYEIPRYDKARIHHDINRIYRDLGSRWIDLDFATDPAIVSRRDFVFDTMKNLSRHMLLEQARIMQDITDTAHLERVGTRGLMTDGQGMQENMRG
ncbi:hypothetical protein MMC14_009041 [Varicellaria rhodocarpa]|nr:hypothetical protein [Varicellaria rhodocarpa]